MAVPVPLVNITTSDIRESVISTGGILPGTDHNWNQYVEQADWLCFDPAYKEGATSKAQIVNTNQFRNYPYPGHGNEVRSGNYQKECSAGFEGTWETYTVPANTYYSTHKATANAMAEADIVANGQAHANSVGTCISICNEWSNMGSPYCNPVHAEVQDQTRTCGGVPEYRTITLESNSCNCVPWTDSSSPYCYLGNWVVQQTRNCGGGTENRVITLESNSCNCVEWTNSGSPYCNGVNNLVQNQTRTCGGSTHNQTILISENSCNCIGWSNNGSAYCSGNDLMQPQSRICDGSSHYQDVLIESNSCQCADWENWGSPYCDGNNWVQDQRKGCPGSYQYQTITIRNNSCNCVGWSNFGVPYCSGNNLVQDQNRICESDFQGRTIVIEENSSECGCTFSTICNYIPMPGYGFRIATSGFCVESLNIPSTAMLEVRLSSNESPGTYWIDYETIENSGDFMEKGGFNYYCDLIGHLIWVEHEYRIVQGGIVYHQWQCRVYVNEIC